MQLYSHRLAHVVNPAAEFNAIATVPVGERWIVKDITMECYLDADWVGVGIQDPSGVYVTIAVGFPVVFQQVIIERDRFDVMEAGDALYAYSTAGDLGVTVSGYVFNL